MFRFLIIIMIGVPALEIWGLVKAAQFIGAWQTIIAVIATGIIGAYLAKREGLKTWLRAQDELNRMQIPNQAILDGISIFSGGLLLLTPGFFTDTIGFLLILPFSRYSIQFYLKKWLANKLKNGSFHFYYRR